ncbi:hypothetical protein POM88_049608 [Heracleum sosnowskyi]|uniref:Serine/threonine-protein kinase ATM n=1 Tax=Heracleum sosnowskyi TaxID=360622 RepID=A0AAD8GY46_9APIA|nr:hypothetical protein POM88_049608 [Heracleum sosnowskyi]
MVVMALQVLVVTSTFLIEHSCQYHEGSFAHFKCLADSVTVMNGINAPKVVECLGSDGNKYRQLAKSGNDDLRQDAVMEQFFGLVITFLQNHMDTWKWRLRIRTYKVVPFTPSAGVLEWVNGTVPLGEYLIGSVMTPYYSEETVKSKSDLEMENEDGISIIYYLQKIYPCLRLSVRFAMGLPWEATHCAEQLDA